MLLTSTRVSVADNTYPASLASVMIRLALLLLLSTLASQKPQRAFFLLSTRTILYLCVCVETLLDELKESAEQARGKKKRNDNVSNLSTCS